MGFDGHTPQRIANFGGLYTLTDATNLPVWASPNCQDVEFLPGLVKTRPGTNSVYPQFGGASQVNYTKTYINSQQFIRTLIFYSGGALAATGATLRSEDVSGGGALSTVAQNLLSSYCNSTTLFSREYMAFSDGKFGLDLPRQWDDANFDCVSQVGPGAPPLATDESVYSMAASVSAAAGSVPAIVSQFGAAVAISSISQIGNLVTVVPSGNNFAFFNGESVTIAGVTPSAYNGTFKVQWLPSPRPSATLAFVAPTSFTYVLPTSGLVPGTGGTAGSNAAAFALQLPTFRFFAGNFNGYLKQFPAGISITTASVGVGGYNGTFQTIGLLLWSTPCGGFTCYGPAIVANIANVNLANSSGGTLTVNGNIVVGTHKITVMFVDREGYITEPAPPSTWNAAGAKRVQVTNIPIGPSNIVARIVAFTPISSVSFFYDTGTNQTILGSEMVINDNTTMSATFDFTDALLLDGTNVDDLFDLVELAPAAGVTSYSSRLFWWGERNKLQNFLNLTFDGGFSQAAPIYPLGWTPDNANYAGGAAAPSAVFGGAYSITGDGATAIRGLMTQPAAVDSFGVPIIMQNTSYSLRVRVQDSGFAAFNVNNNLRIELFSPTSGTLGQFTLNLLTSSLSTAFFKEYVGSLMAPIAAIPSDLQLRVYVDGTLPNGEAIYIDNIEIYPTLQPYLATQVRASKVEDPESYSGIDGFLQPTPENGQRITNCFPIREVLYMVKERSMSATQDDGVSEPANWPIQEISTKVGTLSVKGVGLGDEWAVIAGETGFWYFTGGPMWEQNKLSKEIQPTWDSINWSLGHLVSVAVDPQRKRIYVAAPFGSATIPNKILVLDYTEGFTEPQDGIGRKWTIWNIGASSVALIQRQDLTLKVFFGSNGTGKVYQLDTTGTIYNDDGAGIDSFWQSGFFQDATRQNFGFLSGNVTGTGSMALTLYKGDMTNVTPIRGWFLSPLGYQNVERTIQKQAYRLSVKFECPVSPANQFFAVQGIAMWTAPAFYAPVRGINA